MSTFTHILCIKCRDIICSTHRHDFKRCECGSIFIDGGSDYTRIGWHEGNPEDWYEIVRTYEEWEPILEKEEDCKVYDPDGMRMIIRKGRQNDFLTRQEAMNYFVHNTMKMGPKFVEKMRKLWENLDKN